MSVIDFAGRVVAGGDDNSRSARRTRCPSCRCSSATSSVIIDDGDAEFEPGGFLVFVGQGFLNDVHFSAANSGNTANWNFDNLASGRYQVAATWTPQENRATDAPFTLSASLAGANHSGDVVVTVNQENAPSDFVDSGVAWENLGSPLTVTGGSLSVSLSDAADEFVIADGIRIERIGDIASGPEIQILDGTLNVNDGSQLNLGMTTVGQNIEKTLIVQNIGTAMLELQPAVISGDSEISITTNFAANTMLAPNAEAMLVIQLDATSEGAFNASLQFTNGDNDESPFELTFSGTVNGFPTVTIIDDGASGYSDDGFASTQGQGFLDDVHFSAANAGKTATYSFPVVNGDYQVSATWTAQAYFRATNATFRIRDGATQVATAIVNMTQSPGDFSDQGVAWENLSGIQSITSGNLIVELVDTADNFVIADAVRIERIIPRPLEPHSVERWVAGELVRQIDQSIDLSSGQFVYHDINRNHRFDPSETVLIVPASGIYYFTDLYPGVYRPAYGFEMSLSNPQLTFAFANSSMKDRSSSKIEAMLFEDSFAVIVQSMYYEVLDAQPRHQTVEIEALMPRPTDDDDLAIDRWSSPPNDSEEPQGLTAVFDRHDDYFGSLSVADDLALWDV